MNPKSCSMNPKCERNKKNCAQLREKSVSLEDFDCSHFRSMIPLRNKVKLTSADAIRHSDCRESLSSMVDSVVFTNSFAHKLHSVQSLANMQSESPATSISLHEQPKVNPPCKRMNAKQSCAHPKAPLSCKHSKVKPYRKQPKTLSSCSSHEQSCKQSRTVGSCKQPKVLPFNEQINDVVFCKQIKMKSNKQPKASSSKKPTKSVSYKAQSKTLSPCKPRKLNSIPTKQLKSVPTKKQLKTKLPCKRPKDIRLQSRKQSLSSNKQSMDVPPCIQFNITLPRDIFKLYLLHKQLNCVSSDEQLQDVSSYKMQKATLPCKYLNCLPGHEQPNATSANKESKQVASADKECDVGHTDQKQEVGECASIGSLICDSSLTASITSSHLALPSKMLVSKSQACKAQVICSVNVSIEGDERESCLKNADLIKYLKTDILKPELPNQNTMNRKPNEIKKRCCSIIKTSSRKHSGNKKTTALNSCTNKNAVTPKGLMGFAEKVMACNEMASGPVENDRKQISCNCGNVKQDDVVLHQIAKSGIKEKTMEVVRLGEDNSKEGPNCDTIHSMNSLPHLAICSPRQPVDDSSSDGSIPLSQDSDEDNGGKTDNETERSLKPKTSILQTVMGFFESLMGSKCETVDKACSNTNLLKYDTNKLEAQLRAINNSCQEDVCYNVCFALKKKSD